MIGYLFASPWIIGFLGLTIGPMLFALYASFTEYNIINVPQWVGTANYNKLFTNDENFRISLGNTFYYVIVKTPLVISISLFLAMLMNVNLPGQKYFRTIFYLPTVITGVAAIFLWVWILNPNGLLNEGLGVFGITGPNWFLDPKWSKPGLILMSLWYLGSPILILLAGLNGIPRTLYEAAEIDGAGPWRRFWNVTIPMLSPTLFFLIVTNIIGAFQVFNSAFVVSNTAGQNPGDPERSLLFYEVYLYQEAFKYLNMGYATAMAWVLFVIILIITGVQLWLSKRWVYYEA